MPANDNIFLFNQKKKKSETKITKKTTTTTTVQMPKHKNHTDSARKYKFIYIFKESTNPENNNKKQKGD